MDNRQIAEFRPIIDSSKTVLVLLGFIESPISFRVESTTHVSTARVEFYHLLGVVRFGRNPMPAEEVVFLDDNLVRQTVNPVRDAGRMVRGEEQGDGILHNKSNGGSGLAAESKAL
jgi:hypothetical protein